MAAPMKVQLLGKIASFPSYKVLFPQNIRHLCLTSKSEAGATWRVKHGQPMNPNQRGRLSAEYPDYSYCDGRPTPIPTALVRKKELQMKYAMSIMDSLREVDSIKEQHQRKLQDASDQNQAIIDSKLKPKGDRKS